ncbi:hypothetical protein L249_1925 [Ophiocordyceps polyrhachis-furcata BCC 54312]|uniref:Uncharacterized protein n=1 Tax=Ophiocordyceps polyrhachis-furcata BCC 54312 TaxID=1330021 RepID=A0A367LQH6_9HYPO|nr:hypothetical protein L249_1925 [Ophiocordyceps polyrhachis-furcata BCC 54312]
MDVEEDEADDRFEERWLDGLVLALVAVIRGSMEYVRHRDDEEAPLWGNMHKGEGERESEHVSCRGTMRRPGCLSSVRVMMVLGGAGDRRAGEESELTSWG